MTFSISTLALLAALAGATSAGGIIVTVRGFRPPPPPTGPRRPSVLTRAVRWLSGADATSRERAVRQLHLTLSGLLAFGVWLLTSIPAMGLVAGAAGLGLPAVLTVGGSGKARIARLDAMASWTRSLATRISAGAGLEQALIESREDAPDAIAVEVTSLSAQVQSGQPLDVALIQFADDMSDGIADFLAIALMRSAVTRGSGLRSSLERLAGTVDKLVADRRTIEAERARPRTTARLVTIISVGAFAALQANSEFMKPYHTIVGQLVLMAICAAFGGCLVWMSALTRNKPEPRMLGEAASATPGLKNFGRAT